MRRRLAGEMQTSRTSTRGSVPAPNLDQVPPHAGVDATGTHRDEYLFTTDTTLAADAVVGTYCGRWSKEKRMWSTAPVS